MQDPTALMNDGCACATLDRDAFGALLGEAAGCPAAMHALTEARPHLAADTVAFLSCEDAEKITAAIKAIEAAVRLPDYRSATLGPRSAARDFGTAGAFMGYDFHVTQDGPKLIEINTNAGGAFLNALILGAQRACCPEFEPLFRTKSRSAFEDAAFNMFAAEWRKQRGDGAPLKRVAIVDDAPEGQYLYPELLIAKRFFERRGVEAIIADAGDLVYRSGALKAAGQIIDLVYNRLVDFSISDPKHAALGKAYEDGAVVVTPSPRHHALYADKRNLALLSDAPLMRSWGLDETHIAALGVVPATKLVGEENRDALWESRKRYYFKPVAGYGSRAVYAGAKLTKSKWAEIVKGGYVAQEYVRPSERAVAVDGEIRRLKMDVRFYTYDGEALIAAARLYQGQATNFRTPGGGFSPVLFLPHNWDALLARSAERRAS